MEQRIKEIDELLVEYDLTEIKDYIHKNIKKSISLDLIEKDDYRLLAYPEWAVIPMCRRSLSGLVRKRGRP